MRFGARAVLALRAAELAADLIAKTTNRLATLTVSMAFQKGNREKTGKEGKESKRRETLIAFSNGPYPDGFSHMTQTALEVRLNSQRGEELLGRCEVLLSGTLCAAYKAVAGKGAYFAMKYCGV